MASRMLQQRFYSAKSNSYVKQVTRSNFAESLEELKPQIASSQFISISLTKTGSHSSPWHKISPYDTPETSYLKSKYASERFQILQFSICPFSISSSKLTAHPYNFHLFPRDELKLGIPCYSFTCQSSFLKKLSSQGFDFNNCIYEGISYLSREQQSAARIRLGSLLPAENISKPMSPPNVANSIFLERIKVRIKNWRDACKESNNVQDEFLMRSLRKLVMGSEEYNSRPSLSIDVCNDQQAALVAEMVQEHYDDLIPLVAQAKEGLTNSVRFVLSSSKEDKDLLLKEIEETEKMNDTKLSGFRTVIDALSDSQKPIVCVNSLDDLTFIYSKFIGSLPSNFDEFSRTLDSTFPRVIDVSNLLERVSPIRGGHVPASLRRMKTRFFAPIDIEIPNQASWEDDRIHNDTVLATAHALAKLTRVTTSQELTSNIAHKDVRVSNKSKRIAKCENVVFVWGFGYGTRAGTLRKSLAKFECLKNDDFDVRLVEKNCAIVVFWADAASDTFVRVVEDGYAGLRACGYERYENVCRLGLWESSLVDALDKVEHCSSPVGRPVSDWFISFDDL